MTQKVLFIKLSSIGDILLTMPSLRALRWGLPKAHISFMVSQSCKEVLEGNPYVDEVITVPDLGSAKSITGKVFEYYQAMRIVALLREKRFDIALVFHRSPLLGLLTLFARVPTRIAFENSRFNWVVTKTAPFDLEKHRILRAFELVEAIPGLLNGRERDVSLELPLLPRDVDYARELFSSKKLMNKLIITSAPGGGRNPWSEMPSRIWGKERFAQLYDMLHKKLEAEVILLGSPVDEETNNEIARLMDYKPINMGGRTTLGQSAAIIKRSHAYIGNDSAPLFIAAAVGTTTLGLFGPTNSQVIKPIGDRHIALQSQTECSPCYNPTEGTSGMAYTCSDWRCMREIQVEEVFSKVEGLLNTTHSRNV